MNKIILSGNLTSNPELKYSKDKGLPYSKNIIAINDIKGKTTHFIPFVIFNKGAEILCKHCKKGSSIGITGYITREKYTNSSNITTYKTEIICETFEFLGNKKISEENNEDLKLVSSDDLPL